MAAFVARGDSIAVTLTPEDRSILGQIPGLLAGIGPDDSDPAHEVLHRRAFGEDDERSAAFDDLVAGEREAGRRLDRAVVAAVAEGADSLSRNEALSLLRSINQARLALAARAGAFEEGEGWERRAVTEPTVAAVVWMAQLQSQLIGALGRIA